MTMIDTFFKDVAKFWLTGCLSMPLLGVMLAGAYVAVIIMAFTIKYKRKYPKIS